ncbi:MAG TPA: response regulator transcription factor [Rubrobacter sp.]|nr:response regulator transcription factor [Rubrobacter sp.]
MPSRVLIADDHALFRAGIRVMLTSRPDIEVVGEAEDGEEAVALCRKTHPDLVMMDLTMPRVDGIAATRTIKSEFPKTSVLVLTAHADEELLMEAVRAGAAGYVIKDAVGPIELLDAVRGVLNGESQVDQDLVMKLVRRLAAEAGTSAKSTAEPTEQPGSLTQRELEVLRLLPLGKTNRQIAAQLHLSLSTVKKRLERIISKLGVSDRTQAAVKAIELGLLGPEQAD